MGSGVRPPTGHVFQARRGTLPGMVRTGATFADAAAEYLRYIEHDQGRLCNAGMSAQESSQPAPPSALPPRLVLSAEESAQSAQRLSRSSRLTGSVVWVLLLVSRCLDLGLVHFCFGPLLPSRI